MTRRTVRKATARRAQPKRRRTGGSRKASARAPQAAASGPTGGSRTEEERVERAGEPFQPNVDRSDRDVDSAWIRGEDQLTSARTRDPVVHEREQRVVTEPGGGTYEDDDDRFDLGGRGARYLGEGGAFMTEDEGGHADPRTADERYEERYRTERRPDLDDEVGPRADARADARAVPSEDEETLEYDGAPKDAEDWRTSERGDRPEDRRSTRRMRNTPAP